MSVLSNLQPTLLGSPSAHPLDRLQSVLSTKGLAWQADANSIDLASLWQIVYGHFTHERVRALLDTVGVAAPQSAESLCIALVPDGHHTTLVVAGKDERGLTYGLYEIARAIELEGTIDEPFRGITQTVESPDLVIRSAIRTLMNRDLDATWFRSLVFWSQYLDMLAATRHNRFKLSIGWRSAYLSPPFPYLLEVPAYSHVSVTNLPCEERDENLALLRAISAMTQDRGLEFYLDTYWLSHHLMGDWEEARTYVIEGLTDESLPAYTREGIATLLRACPHIDGIGLSGSMVENGVTQEFIYAFFDGIAACGRPMAIQIELKGVNQELVDQAVRRGIRVTLGGKSCMEHKGLPYHPTQIRLEELGETRDELAKHTSGRRWTRNSYADMLYRPRAHDFMFNLWNWGTQKVLLWGDPEDVAKLARNSRISGSLGMEHGDPLTYKGSYSSGPKGDWRIFVDRSLEHYEWEFERYWVHYLLYGRLMYNSRTTPYVWRREFAARFGAEAADDLITALAYASKTTPLMTTVHAPSASDNAYWPEIYTNIPIATPDSSPSRRDGGKTFGLCNPSDTALFYRVDDYVRDFLRDDLTAQFDPLTVGQWFKKIGDEAIAALHRAEDKARRRARRASGAEFRAMRMDIIAQAHLAHFFGKKLEAAVAFGFYRESGDYAFLLRAIAAYEQALDSWHEIVAVTKGRYQDNLAFHRNKIMSGSWQDRVPAIVADIDQMKMLQRNYLAQHRDSAVAFAHIPRWVQYPPTVKIETSLKGWEHVETVTLHCRTDAHSSYQTMELESDQANLPIYRGQCAVDAQCTDFEYYLEATLKEGGAVVYPTHGADVPIRLRVGPEVASPSCRHTPLQDFQTGQPLTLVLRVKAAAPLTCVQLRYRHVDQSQAVRSMPMSGEYGEYQAVIPGTYTDSRYDMMYYFEIIDRAGNRVIHPEFNTGTDAPYYVVERRK